MEKSTPASLTCKVLVSASCCYCSLASSHYALAHGSVNDISCSKHSLDTGFAASINNYLSLLINFQAKLFCNHRIRDSSELNKNSVNIKLALLVVRLVKHNPLNKIRALDLLDIGVADNLYVLALPYLFKKNRLAPHLLFPVYYVDFLGISLKQEWRGGSAVASANH